MDLIDSLSPPTSQPARSRWLPAGILLAAAISAITGVVSYDHGLDVARWTGSVGVVAYLVPLVPDLMIAMSSLTLIEASSARVPRPPTAVVALVAGVGWTVAQNVAAGWRNGTGGALIAAGIPLALVVTFESLLWLLRRGRGSGASGGQLARPGFEEALAALLASEPERKLAMLLRVDRNRIQGWKSQLAEMAEAAPEEVSGPELIGASA